MEKSAIVGWSVIGSVFGFIILVSILEAPSSSQRSPSSSVIEKKVEKDELPINVEQIMIFSSSSLEEVQKETNDWLRANSGKVEILQVTQSESAGSSRKLAITILYKKIH